MNPYILRAELLCLPIIDTSCRYLVRFVSPYPLVLDEKPLVLAINPSPIILKKAVLKRWERRCKSRTIYNACIGVELFRLELKRGKSFRLER